MKRFVQYFLIAVACLLVVQFARGFVENKVTTELAVPGQIEEAISDWGYLIKDEKVYTSSSRGYIQPAVEEGTRVRVGEKIVTVYKDAVDQSLKDELDLINDKIANISSSTIQKELFENDIVKLEKMTAENIYSIPNLIYTGNFDAVSVAKGDINTLIGRKRKVSGLEGPAQETLETLNSRKQVLEQQLGNAKTDIYSDVGGVFSRTVDGLESVVTPQGIKELTPEKLREIDELANTKNNEKAVSGDAVCKVINNTQYYVALKLDAKKILPIKENERVEIRFTDLSTDKVDGVVSYVSAETEGYVVVAVKLTRYIEGIYSVRKTGVDLIKKTYKGLKVPVDSIRVLNDEKGVYVVTEGVMRFKPVKILHNNDEYAIVSDEATTQSNKKNLKLYDEVVIKCNKYEDGILVTK